MTWSWGCRPPTTDNTSVPDVGPYAEVVTGGRGVHRVVALALPGVVAFDLSIPAQIFGHRWARSR
jgi:hypothetical protein